MSTQTVHQHRRSPVLEQEPSRQALDAQPRTPWIATNQYLPFGDCFRFRMVDAQSGLRAAATVVR